MRAAIKIGIVLIWVVMMGLLVGRSIERPAPEGLAILAGETSLPSREDWMAVYFGDEKIGYSYTSIGREGTGDQTLYRMRSRARLRFNIGGLWRNISLEQESLLGSDLSLLSFTSSLTSDPYYFKVSGEARGGRMLVRFESFGSVSKRTIDLKDTYLPEIFPFLLCQRGLEVGRTYKLRLFNPQSFGPEEITLEVKAKERVDFEGESREVYIIQQDYKGLTTTSWIDAKGVILKEESPLGFRMVRTTREEALKLPQAVLEPGGDLLVATSIPCDRLIANPRDLRSMSITLKGIPTEDLIVADERQHATMVGRNVVRFDIEAVEFDPSQSLQLPIQTRGLAPYLTSTPFVQSEDRSIKDQVAQVIGSERNAWKAATLLSDWVYRNIRKSPTLSVPSAVAVLANRVGDCNEHAILLVALCRSVGIPSRICYGIVYLNGRFYYHAWVEVFVGRWQAIDPTFGQTLVDASHLKFYEGGVEKHLEILKLIGRIQVVTLKT